MAVIVGGSFTDVTVTKKFRLVDNDPSPTLIVIVADPLRLPTGMMLIVRLGPAPPSTILATLLGISVVLSDVAATLRAVAAVSGSLMVKPRFPVCPSSNIVCGPIAETVGASFCGLIEIVNVCCALVFTSGGVPGPSSIRVTVTVAKPAAFAAGA